MTVSVAVKTDACKSLFMEVLEEAPTRQDTKLSATATIDHVLRASKERKSFMLRNEKKRIKLQQRWNPSLLMPAKLFWKNYQSKFFFLSLAGKVTNLLST